MRTCDNGLVGYKVVAIIKKKNISKINMIRGNQYACCALTVSPFLLYFNVFYLLRLLCTMFFFSTLVRYGFWCGRSFAMLHPYPLDPYHFRTTRRREKAKETDRDSNSKQKLKTHAEKNLYELNHSLTSHQRNINAVRNRRKDESVRTYIYNIMYNHK